MAVAKHFVTRGVRTVGTCLSQALQKSYVRLFSTVEDVGDTLQIRLQLWDNGLEVDDGWQNHNCLRRINKH